MKKILVCQHVPHEILGTLNPMLKRAGFRIRYVNFGRHPDAQPSLNGYDGLIVLGGPMSAYDDQRLPHLAVEMKLIESAMERNLPVLGICLGGQLVARTLGARVYANHVKEIGWYDVAPSPHADDDPLFDEFEERETLFQWHGDTFDIPNGAIHLASSRHCLNQAFRKLAKPFVVIDGGGSNHKAVKSNTLSSPPRLRLVPKITLPAPVG
ncbi:MAG: glutamine amidotransferase-related protein [Candidatus Binatia bacterium]